MTGPDDDGNAGDGNAGDHGDQAAMAAEWAALAGDGRAAAAPEDDLAARRAPAKADHAGNDGGNAEHEPQDSVLNQDEIDSLLGVEERPGTASQSGVLALANTNSVAYERLPMLEIVFDRLVRILTTSLRNFTSENVDVSIENITSLRFGDYLNAVPLPAMISVFRAVEWDNHGLLTVDSAMIYSIVDVLLGGRRGTAPMRVEGRHYTTIEQHLVTRLVNLVLHDFGIAFAPICEVGFAFERLETNPRFAAIARPGNAAVVFKLRVDMEERGGCIDVLLPYATLEPVRDLLLQGFMGERFGRDSIWEGHLAQEIMGTDVELEAVLDEQVVALRDALNLEVGTVLDLNASADSEVVVRSGHVAMFKGFIGRTGDHLAVRVDRRARDEEKGHG
ncbi:MAG: flagellar motor switch protein FliM [Alphaproteobacteria bacterium]|jgi:flagellar motor switch protein FliM|nr:flagellar motor switch protein FliM [Alphaproteobacteria bacterium]